MFSRHLEYKDREMSRPPLTPALQSTEAHDPASTVRLQLGRRISELRAARSVTQKVFAEKAGISVSFLSMLERAERRPHLKTLVALSNALGLTLSDLFLGVNAPRANIGRAQDSPLIEYLGTLRLGPDDVEALLVIAKAMFDGRP